MSSIIKDAVLVEFEAFCKDEGLFGDGDDEIRSHSEKVCEIAGKIADNMKADETEKKVICYAALLHDIGKSGVCKKFIKKKEFETVNKIIKHPDRYSCINCDIYEECSLRGDEKCAFEKSHPGVGALYIMMNSALSARLAEVFKSSELDMVIRAVNEHKNTESDNRIKTAVACADKIAHIAKAMKGINDTCAEIQLMSAKDVTSAEMLGKNASLLLNRQKISGKYRDIKKCGCDQVRKAALKLLNENDI